MNETEEEMKRLDNQSFGLLKSLIFIVPVGLSLVYFKSSVIAFVNRVFSTSITASDLGLFFIAFCIFVAALLTRQRG